MTATPSLTWQAAQEILDVLSTLSYRVGNLNMYLQTIADGVSQILKIDWTVVTLCQDANETILASSLDMADEPRVYALHGRVIGTVIELGHSLIVEDIKEHPEYGRIPTGYQSYLGIPLRTPHGQVIGTICSFHRTPRSYSSAEVRLVEMFAERAATLLDNYRLWAQERDYHQRLEAEILQRTQELRNAQAELVERERLAAMGEFAAMIVHEIRSPLTTIWGVLARLRTFDLPPMAQKYLPLAVDEAQRLEQLLQEILLYAKPQILQLTELDLNQFIPDLILQLEHQSTLQGCKLIFEPTSSPTIIIGDGNKLKQVIINIIKNAYEASLPGETIRCKVSYVFRQILIQVHNHGAPIPPEILSRMTQPFFTTKPAGTGLGLAVVKRIVMAHGGQLLIRSQAGEGTNVIIALPCRN